MFSDLYTSDWGPWTRSFNGGAWTCVNGPNTIGYGPNIWGWIQHNRGATFAYGWRTQ
jgi:hypothetical protein